MAEVIRMCAGCRARSPRTQLVRLAWRDGQVVIDRQFRLPGRGVYLHRGCVPRLLRNRGVSRGLRRDVDGAQVSALLTAMSDPSG